MTIELRAEGPFTWLVRLGMGAFYGHRPRHTFAVGTLPPIVRALVGLAANDLPR